MQFIPLQSVPAQTITVTLANQACKIDIAQKSTGLFVNLYVNDTLIIGGVIALNANLIVRDSYLGFSGDLVFYDTQGASDPTYAGLGARFELVYYAASELA